MQPHTRVATWLVAATLGGCDGPAAVPVPDGAPFNILVVLTDDIGKDLTGTYGGRVPMPTLDALAAAGVRFDHAYSNPTCSPSRISMLTGRQPARHEVGRWLSMQTSDDGLQAEEVTIPELLATSPYDYTTAAIGKWHMNTADNPDVALAPLVRGGFDTFAGILGNPRDLVDPDAADPDRSRGYSYWQKNVDGALSLSEDYLTTDTSDEAIAALQTLPEPWFLWLAFSGAHEPWHVPPAELHDDASLTDSSPLPRKMDAMVQSVDRELGRVLASLPEELRQRTVIVYAADNGTTSRVIEEPFAPERSKGTVYDGGVNVPMVVTGPPSVVAGPGRTSEALVHFVDVYALIAELTGARPEPPIDGRSFLEVLQDPSLPSVRDWVYTEGFFPNGPPRDRGGENGFLRRMLRDRDHKVVDLVLQGEAEERFFAYDLATAEDEGPNLLEGGATLPEEDAGAYLRLRALLHAVADSLD